MISGTDASASQGSDALVHGVRVIARGPRELISPLGSARDNEYVLARKIRVATRLWRHSSKCRLQSFRNWCSAPCSQWSEAGAPPDPMVRPQRKLPIIWSRACSWPRMGFVRDL